jgi:large subunit ribosomal protein L23
MSLLAHDVIVRPIITEKSSRMMEHNKYTFEVLRQVNKIQVREAIEEIFKVKVTDVHVMNVHPKPKRMGAYRGMSRAWKKAIVTLAEGQRIEFFEGASV